MTTAVVICPGRGTYNKAELGSLRRHFPDAELLNAFDQRRIALGQESLSDLDGAAKYSMAKHTRGDNASALIYAASYGDFLSLREHIDIVAVTGNSLGWYSALACGGAVSAVDGFEIVNTMGRFMQDALIGGQLVYPHQNDDWTPNPENRDQLLQLIAEIDGRKDHALSLSIDLGGMLVLAGDEAGLSAFEAAAPSADRFPMRLQNHAAFHTHLMRPISEMGLAALGIELFEQPKIPLIDGRGQIWWPGATRRQELWEYTLGHQVTRTYDFTRAVTIAAREFAPDIFIVLGPGATLGGAVAQSLIQANWLDINDKATFKAKQTQAPFLISMGLENQRGIVT